MGPDPATAEVGELIGPIKQVINRAGALCHADDLEAPFRRLASDGSDESAQRCADGGDEHDLPLG